MRDKVNDKLLNESNFLTWDIHCQICEVYGPKVWGVECNEEQYIEEMGRNSLIDVNVCKGNHALSMEFPQVLSMRA